jgi:hypothetical protein
MRRTTRKPSSGFFETNAGVCEDRRPPHASVFGYLKDSAPPSAGSYDRLNRSVFGGGDVGMKVSRKMRVESLYCIFIPRGAPEGDETVRADQNNATLG